MVVVSIFHNRKAMGAMALLFEGMRSFSNGDVMTLELIADVVAECTEVVAQADSSQADGAEGQPEAKVVDGFTPQLGHSWKEKTGLIGRVAYPAIHGITVIPGSVAPGKTSRR